MVVSHLEATNGERQQPRRYKLFARLCIYPIASGFHASHDFKSVRSNLENGTVDKEPPALRLGSDVDLHALSVVEGRVVNKGQVASSMEIKFVTTEHIKAK